jgi:hypothetical protein
MPGKGDSVREWLPSKEVGWLSQLFFYGKQTQQSKIWLQFLFVRQRLTYEPTVKYKTMLMLKRRCR